MELTKDNIRVWVRKFYKCHWTFSDNIISINCDGEEFYVDPTKLDKKDLEILKNIINYEEFKKEAINL